MDINPLQRPGQKLADTSNPLALFLIEFSGMVFNAFTASTKFLNHHYLRTIDHGRGERFDALGDAKAFYHTPGTDLSVLGQQIKHDAFDILVDGKLIAPIYVDEIEDAMNHFELKARYAKKLGEALAKMYDANIARTAVLAARHPARIPDGFGGSVLSDVNMGTDPQVLGNALYDAQVIFDNKNVPEVGRVAIFQPSYYSLLARNLDLLNSLYGGTGSVAGGDIIEVAGFRIIKSTSVPNTNITGTFNSKYDGDFTDTVGICMTDEAVGTVQLKGLTSEAEWDFNRQAWFLAAKYCLGHGVLRPECAVELVHEEPPPEPEPPAQGGGSGS